MLRIFARVCAALFSLTAIGAAIWFAQTYAPGTEWLAAGITTVLIFPAYAWAVEPWERDS